MPANKRKKMEYQQQLDIFYLLLHKLNGKNNKFFINSHVRRSQMKRKNNVISYFLNFFFFIQLMLKGMLLFHWYYFL